MSDKIIAEMLERGFSQESIDLCIRTGLLQLGAGVPSEAWDKALNDCGRKGIIEAAPILETQT